MGKVATKPLPPRGSPPLQSGGKNQRWRTNRQGGYITPAALGVPTASGRGAESEVGHKWARWRHNPCRLGGPHRFTAEGRMHRWPTCEQGGYITPAAWGVPIASERGAESEVAHKWARWLHNRCDLGGPHRFRGGGRMRGGAQVSKVARLHNPCRLGVPAASERGAESEVAHKWPTCLNNPCRMGCPHGFRPCRQNQRWTAGWQGGYITPAVWGVPTAKSRGQNQWWPASGQSGYTTPAA